MSLITQCPACATMFKVVPDQLRISDGWVRCGQCDEVFDANANMVKDPELAVESPVPAEPAASPAMAEADDDAVEADQDWASSLRFAAQEPSPQPIDSPTTVESFDSVVREMSEVMRDGEVESIDFDAVSPTVDSLLDHRPGEFAYDKASAQTVEVKPASKNADASEPRYVQAGVKTVDVTDAPKLSFMRHAGRTNVWQRTSVRVGLSLLSLLLLGALVLQVVVHERDRIVATEPASRDALVALCEWMACQVMPLRQIDAVVIDSSAFTKVRSDVYRLNFALKSTAATSLAMPSLELTLTDMQDQAVIRRVLQPSELGFKKDTLEAGAEVSASLPISVKTSGSTERISGYRLLAFYP
ncbi:zinc-ribbon and DUF3426 domain-containing protein [Rhodoferax saidenbachensis]|uniref:Zn finger-like uncharacterized protein n=1 Tax=Rhodoferax saidenbachensis TaxID=1484693 RepID=A0ABU1ZK44_9BURK|nr:zinc-ribbon and DUF3426 domain-containing protein [Rhodoferax saidenbachensis]MDR7305922.1 putative Zn finger-like uncharacterized protein [Rhodoferax saidenbachensis]